MNEASLLAGSDRAAIADLFANRPPVLVEVRFPGAATSPNWYLYEDGEDLERLLEGLVPGAEVHIGSLWDLENRKGAVCLRK